MLLLSPPALPSPLFLPPPLPPVALTGREAAPSKSKNKQRTILPPNAPRTEKENKESVVIFVGIAALFLSGVLFLFPALLGGAPATTKPMMKSINKAIGTEKYMVPESDIKEGPGPAAAPGTAATMQ
jgi:hypothetical protein